MNQAKLEKLKQAKATLCSYCESDMCEWCRVECLISNAEAELNDSDDDDWENDYVERNYSPSNPWDAPGMSIRDFI